MENNWILSAHKQGLVMLLSCGFLASAVSVSSEPLLNNRGGEMKIELNNTKLLNDSGRKTQLHDILIGNKAENDRDGQVARKTNEDAGYSHKANPTNLQSDSNLGILEKDEYDYGHLLHPGQQEMTKGHNLPNYLCKAEFIKAYDPERYPRELDVAKCTPCEACEGTLESPTGQRCVPALYNIPVLKRITTSGKYVWIPHHEKIAVGCNCLDRPRPEYLKEQQKWS